MGTLHMLLAGALIVVSIHFVRENDAKWAAFSILSFCLNFYLGMTA